MSAISPSPYDLANRIAGPARYKFDVLVEGITAEQARLVGDPGLKVARAKAFTCPPAYHSENPTHRGRQGRKKLVAGSSQRWLIACGGRRYAHAA
jgi:hypothetical protein